jgi:hypothetical protein
MVALMEYFCLQTAAISSPDKPDSHTPTMTEQTKPPTSWLSQIPET